MLQPCKEPSTARCKLRASRKRATLPYVPTLLCNPSSGGRLRHPNGAGTAGTQKRSDHDDLHPRPQPWRPRCAKPSGFRTRKGRESGCWIGCNFRSVSAPTLRSQDGGSLRFQAPICHAVAGRPLLLCREHCCLLGRGLAAYKLVRRQNGSCWHAHRIRGGLPWPRRFRGNSARSRITKRFQLSPSSQPM